MLKSIYFNLKLKLGGLRGSNFSETRRHLTTSKSEYRFQDLRKKNQVFRTSAGLTRSSETRIHIRKTYIFGEGH